MIRIRRTASVAGAAALMVALAACGNSKSSSSVSSGTATGGTGAFQVNASNCPSDAKVPLAASAPIKIGVSEPLSGPLASAGLTTVGMKAYFDKINKQGGVGGHPIEVIARDDAFDAARAVTNAQAFIGQDKVLANAGQIGTPAIKSTQPLYERACVPQLWTITTSAAFSDPATHPWTTLGIPPASIEAEAVAQYIAGQKKGASVVELTGTDNLGSDFHAAFPDVARKAGLNVLPNQPIAAGATSIDTQIAAIVAAKPDAVFAEVLPNYCPPLFQGLARSGYKGIVAVTSACNGATQWITPVDPAGDGVVAPQFRMDPSDPRYKDTAAMKEYYADMAAIGESKTAPIGNALDGYNFAVILTQNLRDAAAMQGGLTRVNVMNAAWHTTVDRPLELVHHNVTNGPTDPFLVEGGAIDQYSAVTKGWKSTSTTIDLEGRTLEIVG